MTSLLLFHGTVVWVAVLAAFLTAVFVAIDRIRRARARRWVRGEASSLDLPTSDRVIRGVLEGGAASSTTRRGDAHHERAPALWVVTAEGRIPLVGELHVIAGSTMEADGTGTRCAVGAGDEVIVHGTLERAALRAEVDYRADPTAFALHGTPLLVTAKHPVSAVARLSLRAIILVAVGTGMFGYEVEHSLGQMWRDRCDAKQGRFELTARDACVLAAATPGNRNMPQHLLAVVDYTRRSRADLERQVWLALALDDCDAAMRPLEQTQQWRRLVPLAHACGAPSREQHALVQLGYFHAAAGLNLDYGDYRHGEAAILAQEWGLAAAQLERAVASFGGTLAQRCKIELFKTWAGERDAGRRLRALLGDPSAAAIECAAAREEIDGKRVDVWHQLTGGGELDQVHAVAAAFDEAATTSWGNRIWTSEHALAGGTNTIDTIALRDAHAIHRLMRGEVTAALTEAAAIDAFVTDQLGLLDERAPLARQLSLFTRSTSPATDLPAGVPTWWHQLAHVFLRAGKPFAANLDGVTRSVLELAQAGDGRALARTIASGASPLRDFDLLAVLPRVQLGRGHGELVEAIRWADRVDPVSVRSPWTVAVHAFVRHAIFDLANDPDTAATWNEIFRRYDVALSSHRVQLALAL